MKNGSGRAVRSRAATVVASGRSLGVPRLLRGEEALRELEDGRGVGRVPHPGYLRALLRWGTEHVAGNVEVEVALLVWDDLLVPITISRDRNENAYTSSLYGQYVRYPKEELQRMTSMLVRGPAGVGLDGLGMLMRAGRMDQVVQVNNWLHSSCIHPGELAGRLEAVREVCVREFPDHLILVKNVHEQARPDLREHLRGAGFRLVACRRLYWFDGVKAEFLRKETVRRDLRLLSDREGYQRVLHEDLSVEDAERVLELYTMLYIEKHSALNVRYTLDFVRGAIREGWLEFRGFRGRTGRLDAVLGILELGGEVVVPFVGYDTTVGQGGALYRRLVACLLEETARAGWRLNYSSGAGEFKRRRGGEPVLEYNAIFDRHLMSSRRACAHVFCSLVNGIGEPLLERGIVG